MQVSIICTILGPDRPGLVERIARVVRDHDGSWLESQLSHLLDRFAGIIQISLPAENRDAFERALQALGQAEGLQCALNEASEETPTGREACLECLGQDRPGIVFAVSDILKSFDANVESLESSHYNAPMSGEDMFRARFRVRLPADVDLDLLEERLAGLGDDMMLDVEFARD